MKKIGDKENYTNSIFENIKNVDEYVLISKLLKPPFLKLIYPK